MKISKIEIEHIAQLARLKLSKAEKEKFAKQLSSVLEYMDQLKEVDVRGVEPTTNVSGLENIMREDKVIDSYKAEKNLQKNRKEMLKNAREVEKGSFRVPKVLQ